MDNQKASAQAVTLPMCQWLGTERADDHLVAWSETREHRQHDFRRDVATLFARVSAAPCSRWALCVEDNYSFAVALLAVLYSGKTPVLPGHFRQALLSEQCDEFDALITDLPLQLSCPVLRFPFITNGLLSDLPAFPENASLTLFTSGSTGKSQKIIKPVSCLERESQWLCARWGAELAGSRFATTVAPHHMYGLSFAFMLPMSLGLPFAASSVQYHEQLHSLAVKTPLAFVSSPAFLKRLDATLTPVTLRAVFSAGGPLESDTAQSVKEICGCLPAEIYGTTESGVIAFRQQTRSGEAWTLFDNVDLRPQPDGCFSLISPIIPQQEGIVLNDEIKLSSDSSRQFDLLGRKDRIIKIAEQRISLDEIEQRLCALDLLADACVLTLEKQGRVSVAAVIVLNPVGDALLQAENRNILFRQIRHALREWLSPVSLPRYWRIVPAIPLNQQGKRVAAELQEMFL